MSRALFCRLLRTLIRFVVVAEAFTYWPAAHQVALEPRIPVRFSAVGEHPNYAEDRRQQGWSGSRIAMVARARTTMTPKQHKKELYALIRKIDATTDGLIAYERDAGVCSLSVIAKTRLASARLAIATLIESVAAEGKETK